MTARKYKKDGSITESFFQSSILKILRKQPDCMVLRNNVFSAQTISGNYISGGTPGQADLSILIEGGWWLQVELKSLGGILRPDQITFVNRVKELGGIYLVLSSGQFTPQQAVTKMYNEVGLPGPEFKPKRANKKPKDQLSLLDTPELNDVKPKR